MTFLDHDSFALMRYAQLAVRDGANWGTQIGLEYSHHFRSASAPTGWTVNGTLALVDGSGADFLDEDDHGTTGGVSIDTAGDYIESPAIFGDYAHAKAVALVAGSEKDSGLPSQLIVDIGARFAANNNETASGFGLIEDGGTPTTANDAMAMFFSDGTDFKLRSGAATSAALKTDDTNFHHFRIVVDQAAALAYAYIDDMGSALGSIAVQADEWPALFAASVASGGSNDPVVAWVRVRYAWERFG